MLLGDLPALNRGAESVKLFKERSGWILPMKDPVSRGSRSAPPLAKYPEYPDLPNCRATTELRSKTWTVVLRCHQCRHRFALKKIHLDRIALVPQVAPCPHCSAHSSVAPTSDRGHAVKLHSILDLREEE